ncbi:hypothetical protein N7462_009542 [Penicillium macrosclerotiorum]|uniref:uncharacterized protein n=1 Tax=Penicillium macrosclerotiorum TaxID=303699 RepID=UPI00254982EC|nr:uncharacterized protein N7462_009542 [Penicillium macrosclerotiorum]KAJ5674103.1 hypothetical protein N7462_009542 [Penicillium macrosclerotiorum]
MGSPPSPSQKGQRSGRSSPQKESLEPQKEVSDPSQDAQIEAQRQSIANLTFRDEKGHLRMKPRKWWDYVVFPIPELDVRRDNEYNTTGKEIDLVVNAYPIRKVPKKPVYLYEVEVIHPVTAGDKTSILPTLDKNLLQTCFERSQLRKEHLANAIHNGAYIAWSLEELSLEKGINEMIYFDPPYHYREGPNRVGGFAAIADAHRVFLTLLPKVQFRVILKHKINLSVINAWLNQKRPYDEETVEAFNFLDHLLRDWPRKQFYEHKRAYFFDNVKDLGPNFKNVDQSQFLYQLAGRGATVHRGLFQTIRACPRGLILNVDTAYAVFYSRIGLMSVMRGFLDLDHDDELVKATTIVEKKYMEQRAKEYPEAWKVVHKNIGGLLVSPSFRGCPNPNRVFKIKGLAMGHCLEYHIPVTDKATGETEKKTLAQFYKDKYNLLLQKPKMCVVEMRDEVHGWPIAYPAELLVVKGLQRYNKKLSKLMTGQMIRYTAQKPRERMSHIQLIKKIFDHENDPNLIHYGMVVDKAMVRAKARLLPNPEIQFGASKHNPGINGRWDLRGKKFFKSNDKPLKSWGIGYWSAPYSPMNENMVQSWIEQFVKVYRHHGGLIEKHPTSLLLNSDVGESVLGLRNRCDSLRGQGSAQLLIFLVPSWDANVYVRIKKNCDCRFGIASQVIQHENAKKDFDQIYSNIAMKINAKLGGTTARAIPASKSSNMSPGSMIIGADVTHPMLGVWTPSIAAMCVSSDIQCTRYMGGCEVNGDKEEIINEPILPVILEPMLNEWIATVGKGKGPKYVYYFRDGVSEGEFELVLMREVLTIKQTLARAANIEEWRGKICVIVANKRHHIRSFPDPKNHAAGDKNGNPYPGTLIDREVVSPHGWDFYLYSHIALQGTSRPVHYTVLKDEIGHKPEELQNMIYEHCYQYARSTTSVSVHPSIYYAHLISVRGRHHEDIPSRLGAQHGRAVRLVRGKVHRPERKEPHKEIIPLLPIGETHNRLEYKMWWM